MIMSHVYRLYFYSNTQLDGYVEIFASTEKIYSIFNMIFCVKKKKFVDTMVR